MSIELKKEEIKGRILIIDDEKPVAESMAKMLETVGHKVDTSTCGKDGLEKFIEESHTLVITDLRLGDMTGTEVLAEVKAISPQTAVIIVTGFASTESAIEAMRRGANDYLTKPIRMSELLMAVRSQLSAVMLEEQIRSLNNEMELERDKLRRSVTELTMLQRLSERMMSALSYIEGFDLILNLLVNELAADLAAVYIIESSSGRLAASSPPTGSELDYMAEVINKRGKELLNVDIRCERNQFEGMVIDESSTANDIQSLVAVPLKQGKRPFGLLVVGSKVSDLFDEVWSDFITQISQEASEFLARVKRSVERQRNSTAAIVENTLDGIIMIHLSSNEVLMNPKARSMLDVASDAIPTPDHLNNALNLDLQDIYNDLQQDKEEGPKTTELHRELARHGKQVYLRLNISLLRGTDHEKGSLLMVIHNVTKEREMEEMKSRLISNISHELRTPTAVVKEFISLILDGVGGKVDDALRDYMKIIQSNIERLSRLIENLLTVARSDAGGFTVKLAPLKLEPVIKNVTASMSVKLRKKQMTISDDVPDEMPLVYADMDAVTQIITNLVENAYKYSPENTHITISVFVKGARIEISVIDEGYGIAPGDQETIFKSFHRLVDQNDPKFQEGVGLGLSVVKNLVTRHGGDIWVESNVGEGSKFTFTLQIYESEVELQES